MERLNDGTVAYGYLWQRMRRAFLDRNPLCVFCMQSGETKQADVVDHITPHRGDTTLFWKESNWQALCKQHHDSEKKRIEIHGYSNSISEDGWPIDDNHPINKTK